MFGLTQSPSLRFGFSSLVVLLGATVSQADHQWSQSAQRERMHQQYLSPVEHQALHRGLGDRPSYQQPAYRPAVNHYTPPRSYGGNSGFGLSISNGNFGYSNNGYGNSGNSGYGNSGYGNSGYGNSGYGNSGYGNSGYGNSGYGNSGYGNQYQSQPSYDPGRSSCGSQNSGYGNYGSSYQHGQHGGYLR